MPWGHEPTSPEPAKPAAEPSKLELLDEFVSLVVHYNVWRQVRLAYEDVQIDIGDSDFSRLQELAAELGIRERG